MTFKLNQIQTTAASGMDAFFESEPQLVTPLKSQSTPLQASETPKKTAAKARVKVGSLSQLTGFERASAETLIHKSTKDLWTITREGNEYYIERLFQDNGDPLKV